MSLRYCRNRRHISLERSHGAAYHALMVRARNSDTLALAGRGAGLAGTRIVNERAVLTLLARNPGGSNAELARLSGLGPQTVSRIVADLIRRDLLRRGEPAKGRVGQPAVPLFLNADAAFAIGIELGWRDAHAVIIDFRGGVRAETHANYAYPSADAVIEQLARMVHEVCAVLPADLKPRVEAIGLASPSTLHRNLDLLGGPDTQRLLWRGETAADRLATLLGREVAGMNDGNAACWAEYIAMPRPRPRDLCYFSIGTFVGAGLIADGRLWEGRGNAANFGSIMVSDHDGNPTFVHNVASLYALLQQVREAGLRVPEGRPGQWDWDSLAPVTDRWLDRAARGLAKAIATTQALVEIDMAVLGGPLPRQILEQLLERTVAASQRLPLLTADRPRIVAGRLGENAAAIGAAELPLFRRHFSLDWSDVFSSADTPVV